MKMFIWKIQLFFRFVKYEIGSYFLKQRIKKAWIRAGMLQNEIDKLKE